MCNGGGMWTDSDAGFLDRQIAAHAEAGPGESVARQFVMAMQFGGCTTAEAMAIMRDMFCAPIGSAFEIWNPFDLPRDRWFRDAWRRSHNGGPIYIDMKTARKIHMSRITKLDADLKLPLWREKIRRAENPDHLKSIWPKGLPQ